jgi:hypothetical protein
VPFPEEIRKKIFRIASPGEFNDLALQLFLYQYRDNIIYRKFIDGLGIPLTSIHSCEQIPFLPVSFFKTHRIVSGDVTPQRVFLSSGTSGMEQSRHEVADLSLYEESFRKGFESFYGPVSSLCILALLPSYLEREGSSLVYMAQKLIQWSMHPDSGFYLHGTDRLIRLLNQSGNPGNRFVLLGVSFALLELAERVRFNLPDLIVIETGGMKGRKKEITREELHEKLAPAFGVAAIHSEYGMTELLSQAYSKGRGIFHSPPWMRILIRDMNDPLSLAGHFATGGINVIDLANIHSCSFIAIQDLGRTYPDGSFEVLGRFDESDVRGCNLLV